jgi:hypothetical protein
MVGPAGSIKVGVRSCAYVDEVEEVDSGLEDELEEELPPCACALADAAAKPKPTQINPAVRREDSRNRENFMNRTLP